MGILYAIRLLNEPVLSVDDFNKNNLLKYAEQYLNDAPRIEIEYVVRHLISESDTEDESINTSPIDIRLDIEEHNFVTWVKAFKCIFGLWDGDRTGAFIDVLKAFLIYVHIDHKKITPHLT